MSGSGFEAEGQFARRRVNVRCVKQCRSDRRGAEVGGDDDSGRRGPDWIIIDRLHFHRNRRIEGQRGGDIVVRHADGEAGVRRVYLIRRNMVNGQQGFVGVGRQKVESRCNGAAAVLQNRITGIGQRKDGDGQSGFQSLRVAEGRIGEDRHSGGTFVQGQINRSAVCRLTAGDFRGGIKRSDGETNRNKRFRTTDNAAGTVTQTDGETVRNSRTAGRSGVHHHSARNQVGVGEGGTDGDRSAANRQAACGRRRQGLQAEYQLVVDIVGVDHGQDGGSYVQRRTLGDCGSTDC